jgi:hypothetical protein
MKEATCIIVPASIQRVSHFNTQHPTDTTRGIRKLSTPRGHEDIDLSNYLGKYDYEYDERGQVPRGATISEDIAVLPNTATAHSPEYFGNQAYEYQGSSQTSSAVEDLSGQFAQTSLNEPVESNAPESTPYNAHQLNEEQVGEVNSNGKKLLEPF